MCARCDGKSSRRALRRRTTGWLAIVGLGVAGAAMTGAGVFASWVSTASATTGAHTAANLGLTNTDTNGTTFTSAISNLLPGDYLYRYANLVNSGGVSETFSAAISGTGVLANTLGGLQVAVDSCSVSWAGDGSCSGTVTPVVTSRDVTGAGTVTLGTLAAGDVMHLRYKMLLSSIADQLTFQGQSGRMVVAITGTTAVAGNRDRTGG